ncbi:MAG TPA: hypothetical protein VE968_00585, partial [Sphingomicrobium sp.]|nr:hypothetical protein [Sphingomicrobium sp.]
MTTALLLAALVATSSSGEGTAEVSTDTRLVAPLLSDAPSAHRQPLSLHKRGLGRRAAVTSIEKANHDALAEPAAATNLGAEQIYPWSEGAIFPLSTAPGEVTDIALQPGESLVSV